MMDSIREAGSKDFELVTRADEGSDAAFEELNKNLVSRIRYVAFSVVHDRQEAEDVVQETLIKVYKKLKTFKKGFNYVPWVVRIAKNTAIDHHRKNQHIPTHPFNKVHANDVEVFEAGLFNLYDSSTPVDDIIKKEFCEEMGSVIKKLPEAQRKAIKLRYYQGLNVKEIAERINISVTAVTSRLSRGVASLKKLYINRIKK